MNRQNYTSETPGKLFLWLTFLLFVALSAGCAVQSYPGAQLPEEQRATFTTPFYGGSLAKVDVTHVDGKAMPFIFANRTLVPGEHTISMKIGPPGTKTSRDLTFDALAGHKYEIVPRPSVFGGEIIDVAVVGWFRGMWEAVILDRNTGETVANSTRVNDTTLIEPTSTLLLQGQRIEVLLEKWGKTESVSSSVVTGISATVESREKRNSSTGNIFFVIRATITKIKDVLLLHFGGSKVELSHLRDDTGNTYKVYYWEAKGSLRYIKPDWFRPERHVFREGSPITLIFTIPKDATPTHLTLVYYYLKDAEGDLEKGTIEIKLPSKQ